MRNANINTSVLNPVILISQPFTFLGRLSMRAFWVFTFITVLSLFLISVFQLNKYIEESYLVQNYEKEVEGLNQENKLLEIKSSQVNSFVNIDDFIKSKSFEKTAKIEYIKVLEGTALAK